MRKKLKPLTIFLSDDELVNFKSHFDEFLNMNCDDKIKEQQEENKRLHSIIKEAREYIDYYGITPEQNDDVMVRHILKGILEILDKGSDK